MEEVDISKIGASAAERAELAPLYKLGWVTTKHFESTARRDTMRALSPRFVEKNIDTVLNEIKIEVPEAYLDLHYKIIGPYTVISPDLQKKAIAKLLARL